MYYSEEIIKKIGTDKELAVRLDKALVGVKEGVVDYLNGLEDGTTRLLYYTSCLQTTIKMYVIRFSLRIKDFYFLCVN